MNKWVNEWRDAEHKPYKNLYSRDLVLCTTIFAMKTWNRWAESRITQFQASAPRLSALA